MFLKSACANLLVSIWQAIHSHDNTRAIHGGTILSNLAPSVTCECTCPLLLLTAGVVPVLPAPSKPGSMADALSMRTSVTELAPITNSKNARRRTAKGGYYVLQRRRYTVGIARRRSRVAGVSSKLSLSVACMFRCSSIWPLLSHMMYIRKPYNYS